MKLLFWNVHRNININDILAQAILETNADIIGLAEYNDIIINDLLHKLNTTDNPYYAFPFLGCKRINIISKINSHLCKPLFQCSYYSIWNFPYRETERINIAFVHFPICYLKEYDKIDIVDELREVVENCEKETKCINSLIVGDYNMNPFEKQIYAGNGLNATPVSSIARKSSRNVRNKERLFFYNPMWNLLGDFNSPSGSYYKYESGVECLFWNLFDQVCIRPSLIDSFKQDQLKYLTQINKINLLKNSIPDVEISDHLPLFFEL